MKLRILRGGCAEPLALPAWIYALTEPETEEIRYVGRTNNLRQRYRAHALGKSSEAVQAWFARLAACGIEPGFLVLEALPDGSRAPEREQHFIEIHGAGGRLFNKNLGAGQNINIRFTERLLALIDAKAEALSAASPGATFTRSDVVRMAVEQVLGAQEPKRRLAKVAGK